MEIVIALELIGGAVFVLVFWYRNPALVLSRRLSRPLLDSHDDEENHDARRFKDPRPYVSNEVQNRRRWPRVGCG